MNIIECPQCGLRYDAHRLDANHAINCRCGCRFFVPEPPKEATSLNCPQCGGTVSPGASRCDYCSVALSSVRCPRCLSPVRLRDARYCPDCGGSLADGARDVGERSRELACPRCANATLTPYLSQGVLADVCAQCDGVWLGHDSLQTLLKRQPASPPDNRLPERVELPRETRIRYLNCPECRQQMRRVQYGDKSGIIIDVCDADGIWFDHRELEAALRHVASHPTQSDHVPEALDARSDRPRTNSQPPGR
jgi:Zn-finger nucleic acid-binding protein